MPDLSLKDALTLFKDGMSDLARSRSISKANEQASEIRNALELSNAEKQKQMKELAGHLSMDLAAQGQPAATIQEVNAALNPPSPKTFQSAILEAALTGDDKKMEAIERGFLIFNSDKFKSQRQKVIEQTVQQNEKRILNRNKLVIAELKDFKNRTAKVENDRLKFLQAAEDSFAQTLKTGSVQAFNTGLTALARGAGEGSRLTDQDIARVGPSPSIARALARKWDRYIKGEQPELDSKESLILARALQRKVRERLLKKIDSISKSRADLIGVDSETFKQRLITDSNLRNKTGKALTTMLRRKENGTMVEVELLDNGKYREIRTIGKVRPSIKDKLKRGKK